MKVQLAIAAVIGIAILGAHRPGDRHGGVAFGSGPGTTAGGGLVVNPINLDLGTVDLGGGGGGSGGSGNFELDNTNVDSAQVVNVSGYNKPTTGDCPFFQINTNGGLPQVIPGGGFVTWTATFTGTVPRDYTCTVDISDDDGNPDYVVLTAHVVSPVMVVTPTTVPFGNVMVNGSAQATFSIENNGTSNLNIDMVTPNGSGYFTDDLPPPTFTVFPGFSQLVTVTFSPLSTGSVSATRFLHGNDPVTPSATVTYSGNGVTTSTGAHLTLTPSPFAFPSVAVGSTSDKTLTVGNDGTATANVTQVAITGANANQFTIETFCSGVQTCAQPFSINATASQPITLRCKPTSSGQKNATVTVTSNATNTPTSISISCTGTAPQVSASPTQLAFGTIRIGATSPSQPLTIRNTGNASLSYTLAVTGDYAVSPPCTSTCTLGAGLTATHQVSFLPTAYGDRPGTLTVSSNDPAGPVAVPLDGTGGSGVLTLTDPASGSIAFGDIPIDTTSTSQPVTIRNDGNLNLDVSTLGITSGTGFAMAGTGAPPDVVLAPGDVHTVQITCSPTAATGYSGQVTIDSDAVANPNRTVGLACSGVSSSLSAMPAPLAFPPTRVGASAVAHVVVTNDSGVTVSVSAITADPAVFTIENPPGLPQSLGAGASMGLDVRFTPTADGDVDGTLTVTASETLVVQLHGPGRVASFTAAPSGYDFGLLCVGQGATRRFSVTSTGTADISVSAPALQDSSGAFSLTMIDPLAADYPATLVPSGAATFDVVAAPVAAGPASSTVHVVTDVSPGGTVDLPMAVTGVTSGVALGPDPVDFGSLAIGATSAGREISLANCGADALAISAVRVTGTDAASFDVGGTLPPPDLTVPSMASVGWMVDFHPSHAGAHSATLEVTTDAGTKMVSLTGDGAGADAGPTGGTPDAGGNGLDTTSYYACACRTSGGPGGALPIALAFAYLFVPRRRRRS